MKRRIAVVASLLAAALCLLSRLDAGESKDTILNGDRIGQVRLGMDEEDLEKLLGKPTSGDAAMGRAVNTWTAKSSDGRTEETQVAVHRDEEGHHWKVTQVAVTSPFFHTRQGNSTHSDLDAIWREFPGLRFSEGNIGGHGSDLELYDEITLGIAFLIERNNPATKGEPWGKCRAIIVHPGGHEVSTISDGAPDEEAAGG